MKPARIPVDVTRPIKFGESVVIQYDGMTFTATVNGEKVAESESARRISEWALNNGAKSVRHEYDGRLEK